MPNTNQNYVVRQMQSFATGEPTQMASLAEFGLLQPYLMSDVITNMYAMNARPTFRNVLKAHTQVREFDNDRVYSWTVTGTAAKNIPIIEARGEDGAVVADSNLDTMYGQGGSLIYLLMPEKYFFKKEIIVGSMNEHYQFRVKEDPIEEGTNYLYTCELAAGSDTGIPGSLLQPGERFSFEFLLVEQELSEGGGGVRASSPANMFNEFSTIRKSKKFTGQANTQQKFQTSFPVVYTDEVTGQKMTKTIDNWFLNEEWLFFQEWSEEKERLDLYARSNRSSNGNYNNIGDSGNAIHEGNGIFAQMEYGNTYYYNAFNENFDLDGLESALYDVCEKGNLPMDKRTFLITTGNRGMIQIHKAILRLTNGWTNLGVTEKVNPVQTVQSDVHSNAMAWGFQFVELLSPNGLRMKFILEPAYDDPVRNKLKGPNGMGVMNSYSYHVWDLGSSTQPNILLCKVKGWKSKAKYEIGMNNPWNYDGQFISHSEDSASIHVMDKSGICILDPSRCLSYLPIQLAA